MADGGYLKPLGLQLLVVTMEAHEVTHGPGQDIGQGADPAHRAHGQRRQQERGGAGNHLKSWGDIPTLNSNFDFKNLQVTITIPGTPGPG